MPSTIFATVSETINAGLTSATTESMNVVVEEVAMNIEEDVTDVTCDLVATTRTQTL